MDHGIMDVLAVGPSWRAACNVVYMNMAVMAAMVRNARNVVPCRVVV